VFARDVREPVDAPLVYLAVGQAEELRSDARAGYLQCPLPTCTDPRLTTRGGSVRDHFAHLSSPDGPHGYETLAHHTAKHLIGRHLRLQYPSASVHVDDLALDSGARPDVLLELTDGRRVAYEVQYAALTPEKWLARHERYVEDGVRDVWMFGGPRYQRRPRYQGADPDLRAIGPALAVVLHSGHPLLLVDAAAEQIALGTGREVVARLAGRGEGREYVPRWLPLGQARWARGVVDLPSLRAQLAEADAARGADARFVAAVKQLRGAAEVAAATWQQEQARLEHIHGGLPTVVDSSPTDHETALERRYAPSTWGYPAVPPRAAPLAAAHWRWLVLAELDALVGRTVQAARLRTAVLGDPADNAQRSFLDVLVGQYLAVLRREGWVWFAGEQRPVNGEGVLVLAGPSTPPPSGLKTSWAKRQVVGANDMCWLIEAPHILWTSDAGVRPLTITSRRRRTGRRCLPPDARGTVESTEWPPSAYRIVI
jgi:hypothetical protein